MPKLPTEFVGGKIPQIGNPAKGTIRAGRAALPVAPGAKTSLHYDLQSLVRVFGCLAIGHTVTASAASAIPRLDREPVAEYNICSVVNIQREA